MTIFTKIRGFMKYFIILMIFLKLFKFINTFYINYHNRKKIIFSKN